MHDAGLPPITAERGCGGLLRAQTQGGAGVRAREEQLRSGRGEGAAGPGRPLRGDGRGRIL